jgi:hypothetical protein
MAVCRIFCASRTTPKTRVSSSCSSSRDSRESNKKIVANQQTNNKNRCDVFSMHFFLKLRKSVVVLDVAAFCVCSKHDDEDDDNTPRPRRAMMMMMMTVRGPNANPMDKSYMGNKKILGVRDRRQKDTRSTRPEAYLSSWRDLSLCDVVLDLCMLLLYCCCCCG